MRTICPMALLDARIADMVAAFMVAHPRVQIHLEETNRRVDVVGEGIDVAVRVRPPPIDDSDLVMRELADRGQCLVASPNLLEKTGMPRNTADLAGLPSMGLGLPQNEHVWALIGPDGAQAAIHHQPRLIPQGMFALRTAAIAGVDIAQLSRMMLCQHLKRGDLIHVLPSLAPQRETIHAVFASRRGLRPSVRVLVDFLAERFAALEED